jgi:hypothetical protein
MEQQKMVKVSVEARSGTARFGVGVKARSTTKAPSMVGGRYPHGEVSQEARDGDVVGPGLGGYGPERSVRRSA